MKLRLVSAVDGKIPRRYGLHRRVGLNDLGVSREYGNMLYGGLYKYYIVFPYSLPRTSKKRRITANAKNGLRSLGTSNALISRVEAIPRPLRDPKKIDPPPHKGSVFALRNLEEHKGAPCFGPFRGFGYRVVQGFLHPQQETMIFKILKPTLQKKRNPKKLKPLQTGP